MSYHSDKVYGIKTKSPTGDENTYSIAILLVIFLNK